ncbi:hypothetical protein [Dyella sp. 2RAB6]|uniref:hypothetical protein n=1 Tax=Dyella sp. 2RAB6 TaxID=3232992 RepID=UPI003F8F0F94
MKLSRRSWWVVALAASLAGCHHGPTAPSADGGTLKEGQTVYARHATIGCKSKEELETAGGLAKQGDKAGFFSYINGRCAAFDKPEAVKIVRIEQGTSEQLVLVKGLDEPSDPSEPSQLWMRNTSLLINQQTQP